MIVNTTNKSSDKKQKMQHISRKLYDGIFRNLHKSIENEVPVMIGLMNAAIYWIKKYFTTGYKVVKGYNAA
jgi:hypothetical protein